MDTDRKLLFPHPFSIFKTYTNANTDIIEYYGSQVDISMADTDTDLNEHFGSTRSNSLEAKINYRIFELRKAHAGMI
jgi:hypothetical protein